jgi:hypothetical protein
MNIIINSIIIVSGYGINKSTVECRTVTFADINFHRWGWSGGRRLRRISLR